MLLWHANSRDYGIAYRVIEECCIEFNQTTPDQQVWFKYSDLDFATVNYSDANPFCHLKEMYGYKSRGILFNNGNIAPGDELKPWLRFVNRHENEKGKISKDWALIACVQKYEPFEINEEDFSDNCCVYKIQPTVEEWQQWTVTAHNEELINIVVAYNKGKIENFDLWERIMTSIEHEDWEKSVKEISKSDFFDAIEGSVPGFPAEELWDFIQKY